jgi:adenine-specific DNA glycosylase
MDKILVRIIVFWFYFAIQNVGFAKKRNMSIFWQMQAKNLSSFPWKILLDWYEKNGRHDLPWREYDSRCKINDSKLKIKDVKWEMRSYDCSLHPDEGRIQETIETLDSSLHSEWRNQRHNQSSWILHLESVIYRVWLSEILLQQTQASRVVGFFNRMIERFPTVEALAKTDYDTFFPYYQWLGYYSRARNILRTAKIIHEQYGWVFPRERELLIKLPGVWPYTAEAICAFGYGIPTLSWDTNLEKVFARYYHGTKAERLSKEEKGWIQKDLERFIRESRIQNSESWWWKWWNRDSENSPLIKGDVTRWQGDLASGKIPPTPFLKGEMEKHLTRSINNALMDFAAMVDLGNPENINWSDYPIQSGKFYETRGNLEPQEAKKTVAFPTPDATIIVTLHQDHRVYYGSPVSPPPEKGELEGVTQNKDSSRITHPNPPLSRRGWDNSYSPFILPPSLTRDTREYVKSYFREKYKLELSVRPPHRKWLSEDGKPYIAVNAQVQVGEITFQKWNKKGEKIED